MITINDWYRGADGTEHTHVYKDFGGKIHVEQLQAKGYKVIPLDPAPPVPQYDLIQIIVDRYTK